MTSPSARVERAGRPRGRGRSGDGAPPPTARTWRQDRGRGRRRAATTVASCLGNVAISAVAWIFSQVRAARIRVRATVTPTAFTARRGSCPTPPHPVVLGVRDGLDHGHQSRVVELLHRLCRGGQCRNGARIVVVDAQQQLAGVEVCSAQMCLSSYAVKRSSIVQLAPARPPRFIVPTATLSCSAPSSARSSMMSALANTPSTAGAERSEQPVEHRAPVGHRQRVVVEADHCTRRVVGRDDEQHPVLRQCGSSPPRGKCVRASGAGARTSRSTTQTSCHPATRRSSKASVTSDNVGMASEHSEPGCHDGARDVAVLDDATRFPSGQQSVGQHPTEGVACTETADDLDEVTDGTIVLPCDDVTSTPSPPILTMASSMPRAAGDERPRADPRTRPLHHTPRGCPRRP